LNIQDLLTSLAKSDASDLHLCAGSPPMWRMHGKIVSSTELPPLSHLEIEELLFKLITEDQQGNLQQRHELDLSVGIPGLGRFRVNVHLQRGTWAANIRKIPQHVPTFEELGLPPIVRSLAERPSGLVLVTGPTGNGKSMTLAAMIEHINAARPCHIVTIEDPIEMVFKNKAAVVEQREVGNDTESYAAALRYVLRQDPDVVMVDDLLDHAAMGQALTIAGTGRLVLATLPTMDVPSTIEWLIESFPADRQGHVRHQLMLCLEGIVSQQLLMKTDGASRVLALEVLMPTQTVRNLLRANRTSELHEHMEREGGDMRTMVQSLEALVRDGVVTLEEAVRHTRFPEKLLKRLDAVQ
jgi:twitching motility protein PilT